MGLGCVRNSQIGLNFNNWVPIYFGVHVHSIHLLVFHLNKVDVSVQTIDTYIKSLQFQGHSQLSILFMHKQYSCIWDFKSGEVFLIFRKHVEGIIYYTSFDSVLMVG
jgi:hypothetical protein